jgi:nicotinate-nucleotide adenylyltransferase
MRLGLMGGTFDPIHRGHLRVARAALAGAEGLDRVDFVPARQAPHKTRGPGAGPFDRFAMAALATAGDDRLGVWDFELSRDHPSWTIETVREAAGRGHEVTLIMGSDSLADLESWRESREILERARVLVYPRQPAVGEALASRLPPWIRRRMEPPGPTIAVLAKETDDVSSSDIRDRLRAGRSITGLTPSTVEEYIRKHHLYVHGDSPGGYPH